MRELVFPDDPPLRAVFGTGLKADAEAARRAYRARLERAQARGILPRRIYVSPRRYAWDRVELEAALAKLPRSYAEFRTSPAA